eukprot:939154-Heterocapsa_arctica.AAC.1
MSRILALCKSSATHAFRMFRTKLQRADPLSPAGRPLLEVARGRHRRHRRASRRGAGGGGVRE